jgi:hypothetical protein
MSIDVPYNDGHVLVPMVLSRRERVAATTVKLRIIFSLDCAEREKAPQTYEKMEGSHQGNEYQ